MEISVPCQEAWCCPGVPVADTVWCLSPAIPAMLDSSVTAGTMW